MASLVITSGTDYIKVVFNDCTAAANMLRGYWGKAGLSVTQGSDGLVNIVDQHGRAWWCAYTATDGAMVVDSVDGASPSSNQDLCDKLGVLVK